MSRNIADIIIVNGRLYYVRRSFVQKTYIFISYLKILAGIYTYFLTNSF